MLMLIFNKLLVQILVFLTLVLQSNFVKSQSKRGPECSTTCGNVTIPYPFGVEENCYLDTSYKVTCNTTTGTMSIQGMNVIVVDILLDGHLRALSNVGRVCYNEAGGHYVYENSRTELSRFPISIGQNKLTAFGCDIQSKVRSGNEVRASCTTTPGECKNMVSCSSRINCCQISIDESLPTHFFYKLHSDHNNTGKKGFASCAYTFIIEAGRYNFSSLDVYNLSIEKLGSLEMLLDWTVGITSCQEAQKNISSYLCKENSKCFDSNNTKGYCCSCSDGYWGNPYLENGCQGTIEFLCVIVLIY